MGGGGKGGGGSVQSSPYEGTMSKISEDLYNKTEPQRTQWLQKYSDVLSGTYDVTTDPTYNPLYSSMKKGLESQYQVGKQNILSSLPSGGQQYKALTDLETSRAGDVGDIEGTLSNQILSNLMSGSQSSAFQTPQIALSGLGAANAGYSSRMSQNMASQSQAKGGMGQGAGSLIGQLGSAAILGTMLAK